MRERDIYLDDFAENPVPVTLAATSTAVTVRRGIPFYIHNTGSNIMYTGPTSAKCTTPGIPIYPGQVRGPLVVNKGVSIYMRGTALQTAVIEYGNITNSDGAFGSSGADAILSGTADERRASADATKDGIKFYDKTDAVTYHSDGTTWRLDGEPSI